MGNSCSRGSASTDDEGTPPTHQQQSRKLAKPRVGNLSTRKDKVSVNLPAPTPAPEDENECTSEATLVDREAIRQHIISTVFDLDGARPEPDQRTIVPGRHYSLRSVTAKTESTSSSARRGSRRGSLMNDPLAPTTSDEAYLDGHYKPRRTSFSNNLFFRRRSLISAAPPATRTRTDTLAVPHIHISKKPSMQLDALDLVDVNLTRAQTPSGYSVLGGFKRGSLQIVNGEASPASSVGDLRLRRRNTTPTPWKGVQSPLFAESSFPSLEQAGYFDEQPDYDSPAVSPKDSAFLQVHTTQRMRSNTSFSFETAPEIEAHENVIIEDFPSTLLQPPVRRYSTKSEIIITPRHSQHSLTAREESDYSVQPLSYTHHEPYRPSKCPSERRPSMKGGVDSGYCSTGSVNSKLSWRRRNSGISLHSNHSRDKAPHDSMHNPNVQRYRQNSMQGGLTVEFEQNTPSRFMSGRSSTYSSLRTFSFTEQPLEKLTKDEEPRCLSTQEVIYRPSEIQNLGSTCSPSYEPVKTVVPGPTPCRIYDSSQVMAIDTRIESLQLVQANGNPTHQRFYRRTSVGDAYQTRFSRVYDITSF